VQWVKSMEAIRDHGVTVCVECGSGRVLTGLLRRIDKEMRTFTTETPEAVGQAAEALKGQGVH
jgi:[acyl-carrier-protein] S-malonyltransferase